MVLDMPPPNMSERPPPLPLCNRTNNVRISPPTTSRTCNPIFTAFTKLDPISFGVGLVAQSAARGKHYLTVPPDAPGDGHPPLRCPTARGTCPAQELKHEVPRALEQVQRAYSTGLQPRSSTRITVANP